MQETTLAQRKRLFGLDLLKSLSMLLIIFHHLSKHGGFWAASAGATRWGIAAINALFAPSVNIFVFVSAYLMIKKGRVSVKGYLRLYAEVVFYTLVAYAASCALGAQPFDVRDLLTCFLPISFPVFWFAKMYFLMYLAAPLLLVLVKHLEKKAYAMTVGAIFLILAVQTFLRFDILPLGNGFSALWFMLLFLFAGYWVRFGFPFQKRVWALIYGLGTIYMCLWVWQNGLDIAYSHIAVLLQTLSAFALLGEIGIQKPTVKRMVEYVSACSFGIYLLHDSDWIRGLLHGRILRTWNYYARPTAILWMVLFALMILAAGIAIETLRRLVIQTVAKFRKKAI